MNHCGFVDFFNLEVLDLLPRYRASGVLLMHCLPPQMVSLGWMKASLEVLVVTRG